MFATLEGVMPQMSRKGARFEMERVKPGPSKQRGNSNGGERDRHLGVSLTSSNRRMRTRMYGGVAGARRVITWCPYADSTVDRFLSVLPGSVKKVEEIIKVNSEACR